MLLVDGEPSRKETISNILAEEGYKIIPVENGSEALKRAEENFFNVALIDLELSDMSGLELATKLRKMSKKICVIVMSRFSDLDLETLEESAKEAIFDYLIEPIDPAQLKRVIKEGLREQKKW